MSVIEHQYGLRVRRKIGNKTIDKSFHVDLNDTSEKRLERLEEAKSYDSYLEILQKKEAKRRAESSPYTIRSSKSNTGVTGISYVHINRTYGRVEAFRIGTSIAGKQVTSYININSGRNWQTAWVQICTRFAELRHLSTNQLVEMMSLLPSESIRTQLPDSAESEKQSVRRALPTNCGDTL